MFSARRGPLRDLQQIQCKNTVHISLLLFLHNYYTLLFSGLEWRDLEAISLRFLKKYILHL